MRWDNLRPEADIPADPALALFAAGAVARTFDTPGFRGVTCYEIRARSIINRVPAASRVPFEWTINPYRGCTHACTYCFARRTHEYLDLDAGHDFDSKIIVKVNAPELTRRELAARRWRGHPIAMGTNVDCYQRAEGRYRLMRGILAALRRAGLPCGVLMAPILPGLTDSPAALERTVRQIAEAGATHIVPILLHLRPGAREWYLSWLARAHPRLLPRYHALYGRSAYAPKAYQHRIAAQVRELAARHGLPRPDVRPAPASSPPPAAPSAEQLTLL